MKWNELKCGVVWCGVDYARLPRAWAVLMAVAWCVVWLGVGVLLTEKNSYNKPVIKYRSYNCCAIVRHMAHKT